ncbi:MAG: hypothetical protein H7223_03875 [Pedobacter sp.]|nr:hypothetical protein [Pedobacter sp.]
MRRLFYGNRFTELMQAIVLSMKIFLKQVALVMGSAMVFLLLVWGRLQTLVQASAHIKQT